MARAVWNGVVLAESEDTVVVEGNHYFPREALVERYFTPSRARSLCPWKGIARYDHVTVDGVTLRNAAWEYRHPLPLARRVKGRVAFWGGIEVVDDGAPQEVAR